MTIDQSIDIDSIRRHVLQGRYYISEHVMRSITAQQVSIPEIEMTAGEGVVLERHFHSLRNTSCLILGYSDRMPVHIVCAENEPGGDAIILFAYSPSPPVWKDERNRQTRGGSFMSDTKRKCYFCAGELENILVGNFDYRLEGKLYVIKQVPASLCLQCGEKYVSGETARKIDMQIAEGNYSGTEIVRVLEFR